MIRKLLYASIFLLLIAGCKHITVRNNAAEDIQEATGFVRNFYKTIATNQYDSASFFFSGSFGVENGKSVLNKIKLAIGDLKETEIVLVSTTYREEKTKIEKKYGLEVKTKYSNGSATEEISLMNDNGNLKIDGYHVKVDL